MMFLSQRGSRQTEDPLESCGSKASRGNKSSILLEKENSSCILKNLPEKYVIFNELLSVWTGTYSFT